MQKLQPNVQFAGDPVRLHRLKGSAKPSGFEFEFKLAGLMALRARRTGLRFQVFSNVAAARPFDDLVLRVLGPQPVQFFIQLKHSMSDRKVGAQVMLSQRGDFSIPKYYECFRMFQEKYLRRHGLEDDDILLTEIPFANSHFVIYTNRNFESLARQTEFLTAKEFPYHPLFSTGIGEERDVMGLTPRFFQEMGRYEEEMNRDDFLEQFAIFSNQCSSDEMDLLISMEIENLFGGKLTHIDKILAQYLMFLKFWAQDDSQNYSISDTSLELQRILASELRNEARMATSWGVFTFQEPHCEALRVALAGNDRLRVEVLGVPPGLRAAKLLQVLDRYYPEQWAYVHYEILAQYPTAALVAACRSCEILVLDVEGAPQGVSELLQDLERTTKIVSLCLPGDRHRQTEQEFCLEENWLMTHLTEESQERLLDCRVLFQGSLLLLRDLQSTWPGLRGEVDGTVLGALARGDATLGAEPPPPNDSALYIPRVLQHVSALEPTVLGLECDSEHLALGGFSRDTLEQVQRELGFTGDVSENSRWTVLHFDEKGTPAEDAARFSSVCEHQGNRNVHWLELVDAGEADADGDEALIAWRQTRGQEDALLEYVRPLTSACEQKSSCAHAAAEAATHAVEWETRAVVLLGESGVGKSDFLKRVAAKDREMAPTRWSVFVQVLSHRHILRKWPQASDLEAHHIVELLTAAALDSAVNNATVQRSIEAALFKSGSIDIFIDGFDEVCPVFEEKMLRVLNLLLTETRTRLLWVASRPEISQALHRTLHCVTTSLRPLSRMEQVMYLKTDWINNTYIQSDKQSKIESLAEEMVKALANASDGRDGRSLLDVPLHLQMAAEAFAAEVAKAVRLDANLLRNRALTLFSLYHLFIKRKREFFLDRYGLKDIDNHPFIDDFDGLHQKCAIFLLLSDGAYGEMDLKLYQRHVSSNKMLLKKEKTGILWLDENENPTFVHFAFVEFFAAAWIYKQVTSSEYNESKSAERRHAQSIVRTLFQRKVVGNVRLFLEVMLVKDHRLHRTLLEGDKAAFDMALKDGEKVHGVDAGGRLALHLAASRIMADAVATLLTMGSEPRKKDKILNWTPLEYAVATTKVGCTSEEMSRWLLVVQRLLEARADKRDLAAVTDVLQAGFLEEAARKGFKEVLEWLLEANVKCDSDRLSQSLVAAAKAGHTPVVQILLSRGSSGAERDTWYERALHESVSAGREDVVRLFLQRVPNVNKRFGLDEDTLLHMAARSGQRGVAELLVGAGANISAMNASGKMPSDVAVEKGHEGLVDLLLDRDIQERRDRCGRTTLHFAVKSRVLSTVEKLLNTQFDPNAGDNEGQTPLHYAAQKYVSDGEEEELQLTNITEVLLRQNANPQLADNRGMLALHHAAETGNKDVLQKLLESGIDINAVDKCGRTPLLCAIEITYREKSDDEYAEGNDVPRAKLSSSNIRRVLESCCSDCVYILLEFGADVDKCAQDGRSPLHAAAGKGFKPVVRSLIDKGARLDVKDQSGSTPLEVAVRTGRRDVVKMLREASVKRNQ